MRKPPDGFSSPLRERIKVRGTIAFATAGLLSVAIAVAILQGCSQKPASAPGQSPETSAAPFFEEVAATAGLRHTNHTGVLGEHFMPESLGPGAAFFDFNNDELLDIYLLQCAGQRWRNQLFEQRGGGRFVDVSAGSGVDVAGYAMGAYAGDVNNDGWVDLVLTEYRSVRLFLNQAGKRFQEQTAGSGLDNPRWATAASFLDFDRDGWLDLVVANYVDYNPSIQCHDAAGQPEFCGPQNFDGTVTRLFRNLGKENGGARFEDVTLAAGLAGSPGPALGLFCADFDGDAWPDIFVADDGKPNRLFLNERNGKFRESAALRGLAFTGMGQTAANMGVAPGDPNGDGLFDLFVTHLAQEQHTLWSQGPRGFFQDKTAAFGLATTAWRGTGFGTVIADFNLDGFQDLALVNGSIRRGHDPAPKPLALHSFWHPYAQRSQLFAGQSSGVFKDIAESNPSFCGRAMMGRGLAGADYDNDGDIDLLAASPGAPAQLFRNVAPREGHWLMLKLIDPAHGNRDAYGAEVCVEASSRRWCGIAQPSSSYLASNDPRLHFGLGRIKEIARINVLWPDGSRENFTAPGVDRLLKLVKGTGVKPPS